MSTSDPNLSVRPHGAFEVYRVALVAARQLSQYLKPYQLRIVLIGSKTHPNRL